MNPITNAKNLNKMNERELSLGLTGSKTSWHNLYEESAWIFVGGLAYDLTEGDVIAVFSQYGEIVNINMVRDKKTGKPKGYCFICYEDQRSTNLAVDNFSGIKLLDRILRVDHVKDYRLPKEFGDEDEVTKRIRAEGCGPEVRHVKATETRSPDQRTEKKKKKKQKIKKEKYSDSDGESDDDRERTSSRHRMKQIKQEVLSDDNEAYGRSGHKISANSDHAARTFPVKVKTEPLDYGHDRRDETAEDDRNRKESSRFSSRQSERHEARADGGSSGYDKCSRGKESGGAGDGSRGEYQKVESDEKQSNENRERRYYRHSEREKEGFDRRQRDGDKYRNESVVKDRRLEGFSDDESRTSSHHRVAERDRSDENRKHRDMDYKNIDRHDDHSRTKRDYRDFDSAKERRKRSYQGRDSDGR